MIKIGSEYHVLYVGEHLLKIKVKRIDKIYNGEIYYVSEVVEPYETHFEVGNNIFAVESEFQSTQ